MKYTQKVHLAQYWLFLDPIGHTYIGPIQSKEGSKGTILCYIGQFLIIQPWFYNYSSIMNYMSIKLTSELNIVSLGSIELIHIGPILFKQGLKGSNIFIWHYNSQVPQDSNIYDLYSPNVVKNTLFCTFSHPWLIRIVTSNPS